MLKRALVIMCLILAFVTPTLAATVIKVPDLHPTKLYNKGLEYYNAGKYDEALAYILAAQKKNPTAAVTRKVAEVYEKMKNYDQAVAFYTAASKIYLKTDVNAAIVLKNKASALSSSVDVYYETLEKPAISYPLQKYEPKYGTYFGAFVEYDANVGPRNVQAFNEITGKQHSVFYTYMEYGSNFPYNWAKNVKASGAAVHIALEPNKGLSIVQDDAYIHELAMQIKESEMPVFVRFASEMNGNWVKWNGDPKLYIEKFRLLHDVLEREAPNAAMVWTPNSVPENEIEKYYPGDGYVDWVGVNIYSVKYFNGIVTQPADQVNPLELLDFVYKTYSSKKPIQISEYAATHYSAESSLNTTDFAVLKMNMMYNGIAMKYPRVKAINWYSTNNIERAHSSARRLNNFSMTENPVLTKAYNKVISQEYFLSSVVNGVYAGEDKTNGIKSFKNLAGDKGVSGVLNIKTFAKTYDPYIKKVSYKIGDRWIGESSQFPFDLTLDTSTLKKGTNTLKIMVYDSKGAMATKKEIVFNVK